MYLQCHLNRDKSRTANVVFYVLCLLYVLSAVTVVCDLLQIILGVSNNLVWKNIIFIICCTVDYQYTVASTSCWLSTVNVKSHWSCPKHSKYLLWLHLPMHHSTHKSCIYHPFYSPKSSKDLPLLDRVGSKNSCRDHSFILGNHTLRSVNLLSSFVKRLILIYRI